MDPFENLVNMADYIFLKVKLTRGKAMLEGLDGI
jgi:hypothetical protein